eukprot:GHVS01024431.1.p1 GENE.GHVS01024431.1~~GHVS01024431.1.p1  ORF type:complete len:405 (+),score=48.82 GHVS01024431.1:31-1245(+)
MEGSGEYNTVVLTVLVLGLIWVWKISSRLCLTLELHKQIRLLHSRSGGALALEGMGRFTRDFLLLQRSHFNQILRVKKNIAPVSISRVVVTAGVDSATVSLFVDHSAEDDHSSPYWNHHRRYGVTCKLSSTAPGTTVQLYWGVAVNRLKEMFQLKTDELPGSVVLRMGNPLSSRFSRLLNSRLVTSSGRDNAAARSLLEMEELENDRISGSPAPPVEDSWMRPGHYVHVSSTYEFGPGLNQVFRTSPADMYDVGGLLNLLGSAPTADQPDDAGGRVPLVIVATAKKNRQNVSVGPVHIEEGFTEVSVAKIKHEGPDSYSVEVVKQVVLCAAGPQEGQDIYGLEDERDCLICMSSPKNTMLLPCRHCSLCSDCLRSLRQERCPICRTHFSSFITFPIHQRPTPSQ